MLGYRDECVGAVAPGFRRRIFAAGVGAHRHRRWSLPPHTYPVCAATNRVRQQRQSGCDGQRIIPARAGNARTACAGRDLGPHHPRAGGERSDRLRDVTLDPIIPARAGNALGSVSAVQDHPRAGGERPGIPLKNLSRGSSPRGRGTLPPPSVRPLPPPQTLDNTLVFIMYLMRSRKLYTFIYMACVDSSLPVGSGSDP